MTGSRMSALVVGATGGIGRRVVDEAIRQGHTLRALGAAPARRVNFHPKRRLSSATPRSPAIKGPAQDDLDALFAALVADAVGALDGVHDAANMPLADEPQRVRDDRDAVLAQQP